MSTLRIVAVLIIVLAFVTSPSSGQDPDDPRCGPRRLGEPDYDYQRRLAFCPREKMLAENAKRRNKERQAKLKADTDKLHRLATELKQQVDKSNENILSLDVIRKAEEIEKLAKSVREKMKADSY